MLIEKVMFHTQEDRNTILDKPIFCTREDAWFGNAFYFWNDEIDAHQWGRKSKKRTSGYQIYQATIDCSKVLDTVFNEDHYKFFIKQLEKIASKFSRHSSGAKKPNIKELNQFMIEKSLWIDKDKIQGILFQDLPYSEDLLIEGFNYRKRIQLAAYNQSIIKNFSLYTYSKY